MPPDAITIAEATHAIAAATKGATQRCIALATGTLSPDLRVNYEFGLVLGVDEFRQEQFYVLEKGYHHNRGLHGFGTVYGLHVSSAPPPGDPDDLQIRVSPGMAIDQYGRALVVRSEQCARLAAWLAKQVQQNPNVIAENRSGPSGELSVYLVASYTECTDALVPIPGQPCSSEPTTAPSRIRDSFHLELRWQPPAMPAWDAVRAFGDLLALVRPVRGLPPEDSDENLLAALVRRLDDPTAYADMLATLLAGTPSEPPRELFRLPAESASAALDRLATIWVTEVRPDAKLPPDLNDPRAPAEAGVLLARIDFLPAEPFDPQQPEISYAREADGTPVQPDGAGRPFLLHTQLIQQARRPDQPLETRPFASIAARDSATLRLWVHHAETLDLPPLDGLDATSDSGPLTITSIIPVAPNIFDLELAPPDGGESPGGPPLGPGELIQLRVHLERVSSLGLPLIATIDTLAVDYLGRESNVITLYSVVTAASSPVVDAPPVQEFVSLQPLVNDGQLSFQLWFHTPQALLLPDTLSVQRGVGPNASQLTFRVQKRGGATTPSLVWVALPPRNANIGDGTLLTFAFDTTSISLENRGTLADLIAGNRVQFLGFDGRQTIRAFTSVSLPTAGGPNEQQIREIVREVVSQQPPRLERPFVTVTPMLNDRSPRIELWFHPTGGFEENRVEIDRSFADQRPFRLLAELNQLGDMPDLRDELGIEQLRPNVFMLFLNGDFWQERAEASRWLRFIFFTGDMGVVDAAGNRVSLIDHMQQLPFGFTGTGDGGKTISVPVRLTQPGGV
ncbi:MAG: hypothetical protein MUD01_21720 [Chloroflexaceae bacterium]|jgi:hypothetical protein|nr:hypothetical protein [Chloroflexaceae bacterium]